MSIAISAAAQGILRTAGWFEGRTVDIQPVEIVLRQQGFEVSPSCKKFLVEFHGLRVEPKKGGSFSVVDFNVFEEVAWFEADDKPFLAHLFKNSLCPIGLATMTWLFMTSTGEMIALSDQWLHYVRLPNVIEGIDWLFGVAARKDYMTVQIKNDEKPPEFR